MPTQAQLDGLAKARKARADAKRNKEQNVADTEAIAPPEAPVEPEAPEDPVEAFATVLAREVTPGRAREEAAAARARAAGSDPAQRRLEAAFADKLTAIADAFDASQRKSEEAQRLRSRSTVVGVGGSQGASNRPIPEHVKRGTIVLINQDPRLPDTFGLVLRLHPRVVVNGENLRWRADVVGFPLHGSPNVQEGVAFGPGVGQFREVPADEDDIGVLGPDKTSVNDYDRPWESPLR